MSDMAVGNNMPASQVHGPSLGPSSSLQLAFAKLQLELAETAKSQAMDRMDAIKASQEEQKHVAELLNQARQAKADAAANTKDTAAETQTYHSYDKDGKVTKTWTETARKGASWTHMGDDMVKYMDAHNLAYDKTGKDHMHTSDEWDLAIASLETRLEQLGTDTQQQMVYIQDYMGQYNSYLQGANTQISQSNQTLSSIAKGM